MGKVFSPLAMDDMLAQTSSPTQIDVEALVAPAAADLLALTQEALGSLETPVELDNAQRAELLDALTLRLVGAVSAPSEGAS